MSIREISAAISYLAELSSKQWKKATADIFLIFAKKELYSNSQSTSLFTNQEIKECMRKTREETKVIEAKEPPKNANELSNYPSLSMLFEKTNDKCVDECMDIAVYNYIKDQFLVLAMSANEGIKQLIIQKLMARVSDPNCNISSIQMIITIGEGMPFKQMNDQADNKIINVVMDSFIELNMRAIELMNGYKDNDALDTQSSCDDEKDEDFKEERKGSREDNKEDEKILKIEKQPLNSKYNLTYYEEITKWLDLLKFLFTKYGVPLTMETFKHIYQVICVYAISHREREEFFNLMTYIFKNTIPTESTVRQFLELLSEIFVRLNIVSLPLSAFEAYFSLFLKINGVFGNIKAIGDTYELIDPKLIGLEKLWKVFTESKKGVLNEIVMKKILCIYNNPNLQMPYSKIQYLLNDFLNYIMSYIKVLYTEYTTNANTECIEKISLGLELFQTQLSKFESLNANYATNNAKIAPESAAAYSEFQNESKKHQASSNARADRMNIICEYSNNIKNLELSYECTVLDLYRKVAKLYPHLNENSIRLETEKMIIPKSTNTLDSIHICNGCKIIVNEDMSDIRPPHVHVRQRNVITTATFMRRKVSDTELSQLVNTFESIDPEILKEAIMKTNNVDEAAIMLTDPIEVANLEKLVKQKAEKILDAQAITFTLLPDSQHFILLYQLFNLQNYQISQQLWKVLSKIKFGEEIVKKAESCQMIKESFQMGIEDLFKSGSIFRLRYALSLIKSALSNKESTSKNRINWMQSFIADPSSPITVLIDFLEKLSKYVPKSTEVNEWIAIISEMLEICFIFILPCAKYMAVDIDQTFIPFRKLLDPAAGVKDKILICKKILPLIYDEYSEDSAVIIMSFDLVGKLWDIAHEFYEYSLNDNPQVDSEIRLLLLISCFDIMLFQLGSKTISSDKYNKYIGMVIKILCSDEKEICKSVSKESVLLITQVQNRYNECLEAIRLQIKTLTHNYRGINNLISFCTPVINIALSIQNCSLPEKVQSASQLISEMYGKLVQITTPDKINYSYDVIDYLCTMISYTISIVDRFNSITQIASTMENMTQHLGIILFPQNMTEITCSDTKVRIRIINFLKQLISPYIDYAPLLQIIMAYQQQVIKNTDFSSCQCIAGECDSIGPYVGLKNFGATCYMNSLLQQLFMANKFKEVLLSIKPLANTLAYELQNIFAHLSIQGQYKYYEAEQFTKLLKWDGKPVNVSVQQDVSEFLNILTDTLEKDLKSTKYQKLASVMFGGKFAHKITSLESEYPYTSEGEEEFITISLSIPNKISLTQSLELFIKEEILDGQYYCEKYARRINVKKCTLISKLPNTCIIHLKRFEFDISTLRRMKINDVCEFPFDINFKKYCIEPYFADSYYDYSLVGVLIHSGTIEGGHYYSYIKERDSNHPNYGKWYHFDDTNVRQYDVDKLKNIAFGNKTDEWQGFGTCAYLLFYERKKCEPTEYDQDIEVNDLLSNIKQQNINKQIVGNYFCDDMFSLLCQMKFALNRKYTPELSAPSLTEIAHSQTGPEAIPGKEDSELPIAYLDMCFNFYQCYKKVNKTKKEKEDEMYNMLMQNLKLNIVGMIFYLKKLIANVSQLEEQIFNKNKDSRKQFCDIIYITLNELRNLESNYIDATDTYSNENASVILYKSICARFIKALCTDVMQMCSKHKEDSKEFIELIIKLSWLTNSFTKIIIENHMIASLSNYIAENGSKPVNREEYSDTMESRLMVVLIGSCANKKMNFSKYDYIINTNYSIPTPDMEILKKNNYFVFGYSNLLLDKNWDKYTTFFQMISNNNMELTEYISRIICDEMAIEDKLSKYAFKIMRHLMRMTDTLSVERFKYIFTQHQTQKGKLYERLKNAASSAAYFNTNYQKTAKYIKLIKKTPISSLEAVQSYIAQNRDKFEWVKEYFKCENKGDPNRLFKYIGWIQNTFDVQFTYEVGVSCAGHAVTRIRASNPASNFTDFKGVEGAYRND